MKTIIMTTALLLLAGSAKLQAQAGGNLSDHASPNKANMSQSKAKNTSSDKSDKTNRRMGSTSANSTTSSQGTMNQGKKSGTKSAGSPTKLPKGN